MLEKIADSMFLVKGKRNGRFPYSHSILIFSKPSKRAILIDTGCGIDILRALKEKYEIIEVINSHNHPDHSCGNWVFGEEKIPILVPVEGFDTSGNLIKLSERFTKPGFLAQTWRKFAREMLQFKPNHPTHSFRDGHELNIGDTTLRAIHTPGHTIDHYCFFEEEKRILFAFDLDFTTFGPWFGHRESEIVPFIKSIEKMRNLYPNLVISSHKGVFSDNIQNEFSKFIKKFEERDHKILSLLDKGFTNIKHLVDQAPIYGSFPYAEILLRFWEEQMILKHLQGLLKRNSIVKEDNHYFSS